jgi:hypothetical protein
VDRCQSLGRRVSDLVAAYAPPECRTLAISFLPFIKDPKTASRLSRTDSLAPYGMDGLVDNTTNILTVKEVTDMFRRPKTHAQNVTEGKVQHATVLHFPLPVCLGAMSSLLPSIPRRTGKQTRGLALEEGDRSRIPYGWERTSYKPRQALQAWPEVRALLPAGHSMKDVCICLNEIRVKAAYRRVSHRLPRRDSAAALVDVNPATAEMAWSPDRAQPELAGCAETERGWPIWKSIIWIVTRC